MNGGRMGNRFGKSVRRSAVSLHLAFFKLLAAGVVLSTSLASLPAHATILTLDAFASGAFTTGVESGFELTSLGKPLLNNNRLGTGNLENDPTADANTVLSLRRQDG